MNLKKEFFVPAIFLTLSLTLAQPRGQLPVKGSGVISGVVWDAELAEPVEYANIVLYRQRDSSQITGTVTDAQGRFVLKELPPGRYYLEVSFIGYRTNRVRNIELAPDARIDLGRINLEPAVITMPGVEATAEKPKLEYRIDKKIINVAQNPALQTGTAVDALENAPAVKVDIEGNVSLRGLSSFTVLIDGRPSPLEGSEALKQIPASTIERIEIVTSPSAKYDPEGKAGIINVILKKQRQSGISGIFNLNGGNYGQLGGNLLLSAKSGIGTFYIEPNLNRGGFPGTREFNSWTITPIGDTLHRNSSGDMLFRMLFYGVRAGADIQLSQKDQFSLSGRIGGNQGTQGQMASYQVWNTGNAETLNYTGGTDSRNYINQYSLNLNLSHNFGKKENDLTFNGGIFGNLRHDSTQTEDSIAGLLSDGKRTIDHRHGNRLDLKINYSLPLREKDKFEAGYQASFRFGPNQESRLASFDTATKSYIYDTTYRHKSSQNENVQAVYSTYSAVLKNFGAMLGIRTEYNTRKVKIDNQTTTPINKFDFFPSLHLSYNLALEQQLMASYTRRIDRPRGWDLSPFITWMDAKNLRKGDPNLKPEYIDAYEAGYLLPLGKNRFSLDGYYRITHNVIQRFDSIYYEDIILHTVKNAGSDRALGLEANLDINLFRFWNINLTGDLYDYRLRTDNLDTTSFNWNLGLTTDFTFPTGTRLQIQGRYESPTATIQGKEGGRFFTSISGRQVFFNRQLVLTLAVRDILASSFHESETRGENFYTYSRFGRKGPSFSLGLTYNFNNYKPERRRTNNEEQEEETTPIFEY